jgi:hypothetical protein
MFVGKATLPNRRAIGARIETEEDAIRYRDINLKALSREPNLCTLAAAISCCDTDAPCREVLCPCCQRLYRRWLGSEMLELIPEEVRVFVATILLVSMSGPELSELDLSLLHDRLRKRLVRAGFKAAIGGTEAAYKAEADRWIMHVHLLIPGDVKEARPRLSEAFANVDLFRAVTCAPLRDRVSQISYLQKFSTYHRPGQALFSGRGRAYPLKAAQVVQLGELTANHRFEHFLFLLGFRRRGSRIEPEPDVRDLLLGLGAKAKRTRRGDGGDGGDAPKRDPRNALTGARARRL